ncbi:hypothetical protein [Chitinophaga flava]|uniref:hypothetical protein n=1 Tax=Chitinophaga flava TaxID=2259036 RepID=UPI0011BFD505|nr:hypothetical protein [Chitinophaga flava]
MSNFIPAVLRIPGPATLQQAWVAAGVRDRYREYKDNIYNRATNPLFSQGARQKAIDDSASS